MSKFDRNRIKDGWEKLCTNRQTDRQRHYENNGHLAVNQSYSYHNDVLWTKAKKYFANVSPDKRPVRTGRRDRSCVRGFSVCLIDGNFIQWWDARGRFVRTQRTPSPGSATAVLGPATYSRSRSSPAVFSRSRAELWSMVALKAPSAGSEAEPRPYDGVAISVF